MQDANEFLTKVLDTIKDEVDKLHTENQRSSIGESNKSSQSIIYEEFKNGIPQLLNNSVVIRSISPIIGSSSKSEAAAALDSPSSSRDTKRRKRRSSGDHSSPESTNKRYHADDSSNTNPISANFGFQLQEVYQCLG